MPTPHLKLPVQIIGGQYATVEQDSAQEIAQCVTAILRTPYGSRDDYPDLGLEDQTFLTDLDLEEIRRQLETYEPRADTLVTERPDLLNEALAVVEVQVG